MIFDFSYAHFTTDCKSVFYKFGEVKEQLFCRSQPIILNDKIEYNTKFPITYNINGVEVQMGFWYIGSGTVVERSVAQTRNWQSINCDFLNPYRDVVLGLKSLEWFCDRVQRLIDTLLDKSILIKTVMLQDIIICEEFLQQLSSRYYIQYTPQFVRQLSETESFIVGSVVLINKSCHIIHDLAVELLVDINGYTMFNEYGLDEIALYSASVITSKIDSVITYSGTIYGSAHSSPTTRQDNYERTLDYIKLKNSSNVIINISGDHNTYNTVDTFSGFGVRQFLPELLKSNNLYEVNIRIKQAEFEYLSYNSPKDTKGNIKSTFLGIAKDSILSIKDRVFRFVFCGEILGLKINLPLLKIRFSLDANISNHKQSVDTIEYEFTDHLSIYSLSQKNNPG
jgi:hypothetical protein